MQTSRTGNGFVLHASGKKRKAEMQMEFRKNKRGSSPGQSIRLWLLELVFMAVLAVCAYGISVSQKVGHEELDSDIFVGGQAVVGGQGEDEAQAAAAESLSWIRDGEVDLKSISANQDSYRTILLAGVDARDQSSMTKGANTDVLMIVSLNERTGGIRLVSVLRDTLMHLISGGRYYPDRLYDKANAQNCYTGISDTVSMLNLNLDLDIREYAAVNWLAAASVIDTLGGVEMTVENEEILGYLNGYLAEVNEMTGIHSPQVAGCGTQLLTGTQAVSFCRVRYGGLQDSGRTGHQRELVGAVLKQMKQKLFEHPSAVMEAVNQAAENIVTNLSFSEIGALAFEAGSFVIEDQCVFPFHYQTDGENGAICRATGGVKDALAAVDLTADVEELHRFLYGDNAASYTAPEYVRQISEDIRWITGENK